MTAVSNAWRHVAILAAVLAASATVADARMGGSPSAGMPSFGPSRNNQPTTQFGPDKIKPLQTVKGRCVEGQQRTYPPYVGAPPLPGQKAPPPVNQDHGKLTGVIRCN